ncbi:MAG TPA: glycosyltransferase [Nitrospiraceae bacterium]|nr:glycosyltransferase [Nitrospiraceae bacterium]
MGPERAVTVVSVTPLPLGRDSRTLKQAMTLARLGYRSVAVADRRRWDLDPAKPPEFPPAQSDAKADATPLRRHLLPGIRFDELPAILQAPVFLYWLLRFFRRYVWQVAVQLPRASLYCLHEFSSFPAVWVAARMAGAPIIYDAHDFYSQMVEDSERTRFERRFIAPFQRWLERVCIGQAAAVLTVSDGVGELMRRRFGVEPVVVRNCHDARLDRPVRSGLRNRLGLQARDFLLVAIGNSKKGYAADVAIEAVRRLPGHVHLALVGDGYHGYADRLQAEGIASRVHLVGFLPPTEVVPTVRDADAAVILYYAHSADHRVALPNKLFQSIAAELPILYPDLPQIAAVMRAAEAGLSIDTQDPSSIVRAVERLLKDRNAVGTASVRRQLSIQLAWEAEETLFTEQVRRCLHEIVPDLHAAHERAG